ncbi:sel1 repeat family protein [Polynucleobacter paneuropaeus]|jgi:hypothetical protein|nr:sel1 repeat family protein [Polynucleobacter paneuropaeus]MBT8576346.1 sel1 repeat family protein [Polynucleobacter paneuropaeus]
MKFFTRIFLLLFVVMVSACSNSEDGVKAYGSGNYAEALKILAPLAKKGDSKAQEYMGLMYSKGLGVPENFVEAAKWFQMAVDQNNPDAQVDLANMYAAGVGVPKNNSEALRLYKLAAGQKNAYAENKLGDVYHDGILVPQDYFEALKWYRLAAEHGSSNAQYNISLLYMFGKGVNPNMEEAFKWAKLAADQKNEYGLNAIGTFYENGWVVDKDVKEAERLYTESAMLGFEGAKKNLERLRTTPVEEWTKVSYTPDGTTAFVKIPSKVVSVEPSIRSIWVKFVNKDATYTMSWDEFECAKQMFRIKEEITYDSKGNVISQVSKPTTWSNIVPNTHTASIVKRACK